MGAEDWLPPGFCDEWEWGEDNGLDFVSHIPTCYRCGRSGYWVKTAAGGWYLQHECSALIAKPTEFEDYSNVVPQTSSTTVGRRPVNRPGNPARTRKQATRDARKPSSIRAKRARHSRPQAS